NSKVYNYGLKYALGDKTLVQFGAISDVVLQKMEIKSDVYVADINIDFLYKKSRKQKTSIQEINKFPSMRRDLSLTMGAEISFDAIKKVITKVEKKLIKEINLFDVYKNEEHLGKGKKSYAISLIYEDKGRTLNDRQVDKSIERIIQALSGDLGCTVRQ
ncbi:MAG: phenylalanine--tRNA ligase subunit beta, partial [Saprospiraceae bacterium]|nr:phenylalanine--tRNA ligase subunit beta [Saprospiraceae bacterium]